MFGKNGLARIASTFSAGTAPVHRNAVRFGEAEIFGEILQSGLNVPNETEPTRWRPPTGCRLLVANPDYSSGKRRTPISSVHHRLAAGLARRAKETLHRQRAEQAPPLNGLASSQTVLMNNPGQRRTFHKIVRIIEETCS